MKFVVQHACCRKNHTFTHQIPYREGNAKPAHAALYHTQQRTLQASHYSAEILFSLIRNWRNIKLN